MRNATKLTLMSLIVSLFFSLNANARTCASTQLTDFDGTIAEAAGAVEDLSILFEIVGDLGLGGALADENANLTVFAPTNDAFLNLLNSPLGAVAGDAEALENTVLYHVVPGTADPRRGKGIREVPTLEESGQTLFLKRGRFSGQVNQSEADCAGFRTTNGLVFLIDSVLIPQQ